MLCGNRQKQIDVTVVERHESRPVKTSLASLGILRYSPCSSPHAVGSSCRSEDQSYST